jgi:hypothetical protein
MAATPLDLVVGLVVAASVLSAPSAAPATVGGVNTAQASRPAQVAECEPAQWEIDAQRLADALRDEAGDDDGARLRQELESAGFVAGGEPGAGTAAPGTQTGSRVGSGDLADLVSELLAALAGPDAQVVVIGPDGEAVEAGPGAARQEQDCVDPGRP